MLANKRVSTDPSTARLLKISASKAAGSGTTEAYPCGTSQGGTRLKTKLGKGRVLARWGWAGENVGIFSSRLKFANGALKNGNLRHWIGGGFQFCAAWLFEVGGVPHTVGHKVEEPFNRE